MDDAEPQPHSTPVRRAQRIVGALLRCLRALVCVGLATQPCLRVCHPNPFPPVLLPAAPVAATGGDRLLLQYAGPGAAGRAGASARPGAAAAAAAGRRGAARHAAGGAGAGGGAAAAGEFGWGGGGGKCKRAGRGAAGAASPRPAPLPRLLLCTVVLGEGGRMLFQCHGCFGACADRPPKTKQTHHKHAEPALPCRRRCTQFGRVEPSPEAVQQLVAMGFNEAQAADALARSGNNVEMALQYLL